MRRLVFGLLVTVVSFMSLLAPAYAAILPSRFVNADIFTPTTTSNKNLGVEYKVISTIVDDTFSVALYQNGVALPEVREVTHPYGDSGVFNIALPNTGTYSYFIRTTNHMDNESVVDSKTVSVQITDVPEPTVTTTFVTTPAPITPAPNTTSTVASESTPAVLSAQTTSQIQQGSSVNKKDAKKVGGVLGESTVRNRVVAKGSSKLYVGGTALLAIVLGTTYYMYNRNKNKA